MMKIFAALLAGAMLLAVTAPALAAPPDTSYNASGLDQSQVKEQGLRHKDLVNLLKALRDRVFQNPGFQVAGTSTTGVQNANAFNYYLNGGIYNVAAGALNTITCSLTPLSASVLTATQSAWFAFEYDNAGACTVKIGPIVTATGADKTIAVVPTRSSNKTRAGVMLVQGIAFTPGTTAVTASANVVYVNGDPDLIDLLEPK